MLTVTVKVDALPGEVQGAKEAVAMLLEPLGGVRVVSVKADVPWQTSLFGNAKGGERNGGARQAKGAAL